MSETLVSITHLSKSYRRGEQIVPVLHDITLAIPRGDFIALMGPSGSGKSTLLNLIAGIDKPDSGELLVGGEDITRLSEADLADWRAANVGFIFQFYNLMPVLNAFENVELPLLLTSMSRRERRERVETALALVGLADRMDHNPNELSGGQQQRVAIARAFITDPTLIVADEPTGDLDRKSAEEVLGLMRRLNTEMGKTIIMVSHDGHAVQSARHVTHLEKGELLPWLMHYLKLIFKNIFRHKLRSSLTIVGLVVAILAFGLLRTVVHAWYAGADMASAQRLITRNATSLVFALPAYYRERIRAVDGVNKVVISNWFGGIYKDQSFGNFFAQFAIDGPYFELYPEFLVKPEEVAAWKADRRGAMVGRLLADTYGFKIGDRIALKGAIYGGDWEFTVRGIYEPRDETTVTRQMYFHWDYLNEVMKKRFPKRAEFAGVFVVQIADGSRAAEISQAIDREFRNSLAESLTETEKAFQLGFVAQTEAIVTALKIVSFVVIVIILAVVANTMAMTARERLAEYATLKALGFSPTFVAALIVGESVMMTALGGAIGIALTFPVAAGFKKAMGTFFPVFHVTEETLQMQLAAALTVGVLAAILPSIRAARVKIVDGLRYIG